MTNHDDARADADVMAPVNELTGAYLVLLDPADLDTGMSALASEAGIGTAEHVSASEAETVSEVLAQGAPVVFDEIGVAVVAAAPDQERSFLQAASASPGIQNVEPERIMRVLEPNRDYLLGYRDGVNDVVERALAGARGATGAAVAADDWDETLTTWGLQATRTTESCHSGDQVRVAVLDTGMDVTHRDFAGRPIKTASFIPNEAVDDGHGHGTHCIGTACGPREPTALPRYGVANDAVIYAGKVLSNAGSGADRGILAGINWAVAEGCAIISMSLGSPTKVGDTFSPVYEQIAQRARQRGTLIVAAAGNESDRPGHTATVGRPANCPSILAVAALARDLTVADFSCAGLNPNGGQVDIAGPGVDVLSSWPERQGYRRLRGTSMATPHVAGVLALLAEANPTATPADLTTMLLANARRLPLPASDVGAGLVQAP